MEHKNLDSFKALLVILQDAGVSRYINDNGRVEVEFHRPIPMGPLAGKTAPVVPRDPVQEQLATKHPNYAAVLPGGVFPTHAPPKTPPPKAE